MNCWGGMGYCWAPHLPAEQVAGPLQKGSGWPVAAVRTDSHCFAQNLTWEPGSPVPQMLTVEKVVAAVVGQMDWQQGLLGLGLRRRRDWQRVRLAVQRERQLQVESAEKMHWEHCWVGSKRLSQRDLARCFLVSWQKDWLQEKGRRLLQQKDLRQRQLQNQMGSASGQAN